MNAPVKRNKRTLLTLQIVAAILVSAFGAAVVRGQGGTGRGTSNTGSTSKPATAKKKSASSSQSSRTSPVQSETSQKPSRVLWITRYGDPRKGAYWYITDKEKELSVFSELLRSVKEANGTIEFHDLPELDTSRLTEKYDTLILDTCDSAALEVAQRFVQNGKGVLVMGDYFVNCGEKYMAEMASENLASRYGITIQKDGQPSDSIVRFRGNTHPISRGVQDIYRDGTRGESVKISGTATPVLSLPDGRVMAAAWDGKEQNEGRLFVISDSTFFWGKSIRPRGTDHFKLWTQAFVWLAGN